MLKDDFEIFLDKKYLPMEENRLGGLSSALGVRECFELLLFRYVLDVHQLQLTEELC